MDTFLDDEDKKQLLVRSTKLVVFAAIPGIIMVFLWELVLYLGWYTPVLSFSARMFAYLIAFVVVYFVLIRNELKIQKDLQKGIKRVAQTKIISSERLGLTEVFILENQLRLYRHVVKNAGLRITDLKPGNWLEIEYLPLSEMVIKARRIDRTANDKLH